MATISKDGKSSYHVQGLVKRDKQHSHDGPEVTRPSGHKDTRKWCKGKVGREHKPEAVLIAGHGSIPQLVYACKKCGKELDHFWGKRKVDEKPWATKELVSDYQRAMSAWRDGFRKH